MDLHLLTCFVTSAEELHFGHAAKRLDILPSSLGRNIKLLEEQLGVRLFERSTRNVVLTHAGLALLHEARALLHQAASAFDRVRAQATAQTRVFRIGAIDSAATGLVPPLMQEMRHAMPDLQVLLVEDKTARLLPKLMSGGLDLAFVRPPIGPRAGVHFEPLIDEATVVALPAAHPLATRAMLTIADLAGVPLIVPSPRNRPHSYHLTMRLFHQAGLQPTLAQQAEEKQTIVNLVGAGIGAALVPLWTNRIAVPGVAYIPLVNAERRVVRELPLAGAWARGVNDPLRDQVMALARACLPDDEVLQL